MRKAILCILALSMSGCGTAQLVSTRYKPKKEGTVKLNIPGPAAKNSAYKEAQNIMQDFCAPDKPEITGEDIETSMSGLYNNGFGGTNMRYSNSPLVHFECIAEPIGQN